MPTIYDNIDTKLLDELRVTLKGAYRADFCSGYFNLRGWRSVADIVESWPQDGSPCRLLVGMTRLPQEELRLANGIMARDEPLDNAAAARFKKAFALQMRAQLATGLPTEADQQGLLQLAAHLRQGRLTVKCLLGQSLHAKLYLCHRQREQYPTVAYLGSSNFTMSGLKGQGELNVDVIDTDATAKLIKWFNERWDNRWCLDVSKELADIIESSWVTPISPYQIYLKMAYHLSREARAGVNEYAVPGNFVGRLFDFQLAAVKIAAHHINARGGVLLGDVVGLGKTMMACAVASIFTAPPYFLEVLVLCPANLEHMWKDALVRHGVPGHVMKLSQAHKLESQRRFRLVIIDESHNLRSGSGSRYKQILDYIEKNESKLLLLSATPYNKEYRDLFNQLRLFVPPDKSLGVRPERLLKETTVPEFTARHQCAPDTLAAFSHSYYADDWRELMRLYLVRRTRTFIKTNYARTDEQDRKYLTFPDGSRFYFPERLPRTVAFPVHPLSPVDQYARLYSTAVVDHINNLNLPRYGLALYLKKESELELKPHEAAIIADLSRAGKRMMGFCRTNLFKRLESSGYAFLLSVQRHLQRNWVVLHALESGLPLPVGTQDASLLDSAFNDEDDDGELFAIDALTTGAARTYETYRAHTNKFSWLSAQHFEKSLRADLLADNRALQHILDLSGPWSAAQDKKLEMLRRIVHQEHPDKKVLVFSQFADTVRYLGEQLEGETKDLAFVTGQDSDPTALAQRFSPRSNDVEVKQELRVLIATDVLSEGQNLQDGHIVINFDLPWAIIRLIQRAGRVDRIGQNSPQILCYSFLPADGIEKLIALRTRLKHRLHENAEVLGTDEQFFDDETAGEMRNLYHEKAGILDDDEGGEVDLASQAYQIWKNAIDADPVLERLIPALDDVVQGARERSAGQAAGTIVYTRTAGDTDALVWVAPDGQILTQSQWQILREAACRADEPSRELAANHYQLVEAGVYAALETEKSLAGGLGKPTGARYKAFHVLKRYRESERGTLMDTPQLSQVADALYKSPLKSAAKDSINWQFKIKTSDEDIVRLLESLHEENRLVQNEEESAMPQEPRLICSLGLV